MYSVTYYPLFDRNWFYNHYSQKIKEEYNRSKRNG